MRFSMWLSMCVAILLSCDKGDFPDSRIRDPWEAQRDATLVLGEVALCSGQADFTRSSTGACGTRDGFNGGYTCQTATGRVAVCEPDQLKVCRIVGRVPAERPTP